MLCKSGSSKMPCCSNSQSAKLICGFAVLGTFQSPLFSKPDPSLASKLGDFATRPGTADPAEHACCITSAGLGEPTPRARTGKSGVLAGGHRGHSWDASPRKDRRGNSGECRDCGES